MKQPLPPLLERTAAILTDSARLLLEIEDSIAPLLEQLFQTDSGIARANFRASVISLQKIDLLSQTLQDLSCWLDDLAAESRHQISGNLVPETAMTRLRLTELRQRLMGHTLSLHPEVRSEPLLF